MGKMLLTFQNVWDCQKFKFQNLIYHKEAEAITIIGDKSR